VTLNDLERRNGRYIALLRYFTEFGKPALQKTIMAEFMQESIVLLVRVQCCRKESSRSLFHLLVSYLFFTTTTANRGDRNGIHGLTSALNILPLGRELRVKRSDVKTNRTSAIFKLQRRQHIVLAVGGSILLRILYC